MSTKPWRAVARQGGNRAAVGREGSATGMDAKKATWVDKMLEIVAAAFLFALVALVLRSVIGRYVFNSSDPYTEELTRLLFPWLVFIGAALAVRRNANLAVTILSDRLPRSIGRAVAVGVLTVTAVFLAVLVVKGFAFSVATWDQVTSGLEARKTWFYLSVPVGGLFMLAATLEELVYRVRGWVPAKPPHEG